MKQIPFYNTRIEGGFWGDRQKTSRDVTVDAVYDSDPKKNPDAVK